MSALRSKADIAGAQVNVRWGPIATIVHCIAAGFRRTRIAGSGQLLMQRRRLVKAREPVSKAPTEGKVP